MTDPRLQFLGTTVNGRLYSRTIDHVLNVEGYKTDLSNRILRFLNREVYPDLVRQTRRRVAAARRLGEDPGPATTARLRQLSRANREILRNGWRTAAGRMRRELKEFAVTEAGWQRGVIADESPLPLNVGLPANTQLAAIVDSGLFPTKPHARSLNQWAARQVSRTKKNIDKAVRVGLTEGKTTPQIIRDVRNATSIGRRDAETLVRTAAQHVSNQARQATYKENSDLISAIKYVATLDADTSDICISLDSKVYPIDEGPRPPMHHQCRSTTVPVLKSWRELGFDLNDLPPSTRASMDGQVPATITYGEWLSSKPRPFARQVLGRGREELFHRGELAADKLIDRRFKPIPLRRLQVREVLSARSPTLFSGMVSNPAIAGLIEELEKATDPKDKKRIRAKLRRLGHTGGTKKPRPKPAPMPKPKPIKPPPNPPPPPPPAIVKPPPVVNPKQVEIDKLVAELEIATTKNEKARIRRKLRALGHTGGTRGTKKPAPAKVPAAPRAPRKVAGVKNADQILEEFERELKSRGLSVENLSEQIDEVVKELDKIYAKLPPGVDPKTVPGYTELNDRRVKLLKRINSRQLKNEARDLLIELAKVDDPISIRVTGGGEQFQKKSRAASEFLQNFISRSQITHRETSQRGVFDVAGTLGSRDTRASANPGRGTINMGTTSPTKTFVHEIGHIVEHRIGGAPVKREIIRRGKLLDERPRKLRDLVPYADYRPDEVAYPDEFYEPYVGKVYYGKPYTEMVSMVMEDLYDNPTFVIGKDRESVRFVLDFLRGTL